jgi:hypothetical protein
VQLHGTVESIVIVLTFHQAPATNLKLFYHSSSLDSLGRILGKGRRRLMLLLCFFLFVLLILHLYSYLLFLTLFLLIQQSPYHPKALGFQRGTVKGRQVPRIQHVHPRSTLEAIRPHYYWLCSISFLRLLNHIYQGKTTLTENLIELNEREVCSL